MILWIPLPYLNSCYLQMIQLSYFRIQTSIIQVILNRMYKFSLTIIIVNWTYVYEMCCAFFTTHRGYIFRLTNFLGHNWSLTPGRVNLPLKWIQNITWLDDTPHCIDEKPSCWLNLYVLLHSFHPGANSLRHVGQHTPGSCDSFVV